MAICIPVCYHTHIRVCARGNMHSRTCARWGSWCMSERGRGALQLPSPYLALGLDERSLLDLLERRGPGLRRRLGDAARAGAPFGAVVLIAGTDDMGGEAFDADATADAVCALTAAAAGAGARVAVVAPPAAPGSAAADRARALAAALRSRLGGAALLLELEAPPAEQWEGDGLHLTRAGYAACGRSLAGALRPWLQGHDA